MTGLIRVDDVSFDLAVDNMIRLTGVGGLEAQWLVQAVLAPALLAPKKLMASQPREYYDPFEDLDPVPGEDCPHAYLRTTGEVILCAGPCPDTPPGERGRPGEHPHKDGWHEGSPGTVIWHEGDPRSLNIVKWRGDTA